MAYTDMFVTMAWNDCKEPADLNSIQNALQAHGLYKSGRVMLNATIRRDQGYAPKF